MFSKACEYGIRAMLWINSNSNEEKPVRASLKEISSRTDMPEAFTGKILQTLKKSGLLTSSKGPQGGYVLSKEANEIRLIDIVLAIDGNDLFTKCAMGLPNCGEGTPCPLHDSFVSIRSDIHELLHSTTLDRTTEGLLKGETVIVR
ncbi:MAG: Rrf2 family transcriptional regulator [Bacteroidetes bacterium]|uniref:Rrf2 family transcriptional regulator n=1 Tax=Phaeocystidibacter marisrubri TaxID=1577780 RepID=A0A6L3ZGX6_9FLAO|nr:Rrf2 family transcriptional regulator [Phaeocystidibacter marisrubri]KAB2816584.1 Rrf2 family transcriptional regulator [Phaeocystidibacter marisrubri]TNE28825.1 MAG: Rrf2 family transcriptional regulator [Bacteroidota bacterium]GGH69791.1 hypothetical protein GCM10011318_11180 [Phaeocystidibacter marisrubri]